MKIIIPGIPIPQARMRHSSFGGFVKTYDPNSKEKVKIRAYLETCKADLHFDFPRISFLFHMPIPKSTPKRSLALHESGRLKHIKKPDVDNLIKLYLDVLDGIIIHEDQKVSLGPCCKIYGKDPKTIIWIHETTEMIQPWELDVAFLDVEEPDIPSFSTQDYPHGSCSLWTQVRTLFGHTNSLDETIPT